MQPQTVTLNRVRLSDEEIMELNSAHFSLRVALVLLIITIIIFAIMELIKLVCQIIKIRAETEKYSVSDIPEITIHTNKSKRKKELKHSLPSKQMNIQLSLRNEQEKDTKSDDHEMFADETATTITTTTTSTKKENKKKKEDKDESQNEVWSGAARANAEVKNFSDELTLANIKDSLAIFGSSNVTSSTPIRIKPTILPSPAKAQDSLMIVNDQPVLKRSHSAEKALNRDAIVSDEAKPTFLAAKAQDSLMVVNDQAALKRADSAEQVANREPKTAEQVISRESKTADKIINRESKNTEQNEIAL